MTTDLKPCPNPWCGSTDIHAHTTWDGLHHYFQCWNCRLTSPIKESRKSARALWNTRAEHSAEIEAEKYRKALYDMMMDMTLAKFALAADSSTVEELPKFFDVSIKKAKEALGDE